MAEFYSHWGLRRNLVIKLILFLSGPETPFPLGVFTNAGLHHAIGQWWIWGPDGRMADAGPVTQAPNTRWWPPAPCAFLTLCNSTAACACICEHTFQIHLECTKMQLLSTITCILKMKVPCMITQSAVICAYIHYKRPSSKSSITSTRFLDLATLKSGRKNTTVTLIAYFLFKWAYSGEHCI